MAEVKFYTVFSVPPLSYESNNVSSIHYFPNSNTILV